MSEVVVDAGATAGGLLREARQAAGVHIAALAVALKVPVSKLEALESDNYDALPDTVFVRALASSVCRTLKLDPAPVLALLPQSKSPQLTTDSAGLNAPVKGSAGKSSSAPSFSSGSTSRSVMLIALALLVGAALLIFLPRQQPADPASGPLASAPSAAAGVNEGARKDEPVVPAAASSPSLSMAEPPPTGAVQAAASERRDPASAPAVAIAASAAASPTASAALTAASSDVPGAAAGTLVLRARAESWVQVRDAAGTVVFQRKLAAGESASVAGPVPLAVVVGRADATEVFVRGKPFDLTAVSRENVARFEVK